MDKIHPIISHPHTYTIIHLSWKMDPLVLENTYLDMHLKKDHDIKKLRFSNPVEVKIDQGFNGQISGFEILDISNRQCDRINIEVRNFEQDPGITFMAKDVIEID